MSGPAPVQDDFLDPGRPRTTGISLTDRFGVPPLTALDARSGYWGERKAEWRAFGVRGEEGRSGGRGPGPAVVADLEALLSDPQHPGWGDPPLPEWVRVLRAPQRDAILAAVDAFGRGARHVVVSAPTGSGKTVIGECVRRALGGRGTYVCVDKGLQDQVLRDFPYAAVLKGRANYPTLDYPERHAPPERLSCDDCTAEPPGRPRCKWCSDTGGCPYRIAKAVAKDADLSVLNTAYLLAEANTAGAFSDLPFVIADECDRLEGALMSHVSVTVGARRLQGWGIEPLDQKQDPDSAAAWVRDRVLPAAERAVAVAREGNQEVVQTRRELRALRNLCAGLDRILEEIPSGGWVWSRTKIGAQEFKPVRVARWAEPYLWRHAERWLLMSATVLSGQDMLEDLGVQDPWGWAEIDLPSPFSVENRRVHLLGVAQVVRSNPGAAAEIAAALPGILDRHREDRVLVHTVSFRLQEELERLLPHSARYLWYRGSAERSEVLGRYLEEPASVLFAPALERGVDLPDDACRAVVVCKVPYPDLGDPQVAARVAGQGGNRWYRNQTLRSLIQMTGRGVRHERDSCAAYVLDRQADRIVHQERARIPKWWLEAVVFGTEGL